MSSDDPRAALRAHIASTHSDWLVNAARFPLDVGPGWLPLVRATVNLLGNLARKHGARVTIRDCKEKWGGLRVYWHCEGTVRFEVAAHRLIAHAESHSLRVCDLCGEPGRLRTTGWWATRCDQHTHGRL